MIVLFGSVLNYVNWFHWVPIQPAFCLSAAHFVSSVLFTHKIRENFRRIIGILFVAIVIFGVIGTGSLITIDLSAFQFETFSFAGTQLVNRIDGPIKYPNNETRIEYSSKREHTFNSLNNNMAIVSSPIYSWVFKYVFNYGDHDTIAI